MTLIKRSRTAAHLAENTPAHKLKLQHLSTFETWPDSTIMSAHGPAGVTRTRPPNHLPKAA